MTNGGTAFTVLVVVAALAVGGIGGWLLHTAPEGSEPAPATAAELESDPRYRELRRENERLREELEGMRLAVGAATEPAAPEGGTPGSPEAATADDTRPELTEEEIEALEREIAGIAYHLDGDPTNVDLLRKFVETSARVGDYDGAIEKLKALLEKNPDSADLLTQLGRAFLFKTRSTTNMMEQGKFAFTAISQFDTALEKDSGHFDARFNRAVLNYYMPTFMKRTDQAVADLAKLVEQSGGGAGDDRYRAVYRFLGRAQAKAGSPDEARNTIDTALELFPGDKRLTAERDRLAELGQAAEIR